MILVIFISLSLLKEYTPISKFFVKSELGVTWNGIFSEMNSGDTSRKTYMKGEFAYLDFQTKNLLIGAQRSSNGTLDSGCPSNKIIKYRYYQMYDNLNYLCYENFIMQDSGIRVGFIKKINESNFSIYSIFGGGQGELSTRGNVWGKYQFTYNYLNIILGLGYSVENSFFNTPMVFKIELGYKRSYFENHFLQKNLTAYQNDYTIGIGIAFQVNFKSETKRN